MTLLIRTVAGLTGYARYSELAGGAIITRSMASVAIAWAVGFLQVDLKNRVKNGTSVTGTRPGFEFLEMAITAVMRTLVVVFYSEGI
jgi:hypothetical protein